MSAFRGWLPALLVFVAVLTARWALIAGAGSDVPYWDQWTGEALQFYRPWLEGKLGWAEWFTPHNEHRIVLTRALNLVLLALNGQWDPLLTMTVMALLPAATAAGLVRVMQVRLPGRWALAGMLAVLLLFALPHAWQNTLWSFQSQMYFGVALALAALVAFTAEKSDRANLASVIGAGSLWLSHWAMAVAGGCALALAAWATLRILEEPRVWRRPLFVLLVAVAMVGLEWWTRVPVAEHAALRAPDVGSFVAAWIAGLAWPGSEWPWLFLPLNAPLLALGISRLVRRGPRDAASDLAIVLGTWAAVIAAGFAWMRGGAGAGPPASRYTDFLLFLPLANLFALATWASVSVGREAAVRRVRWAAIAWALLAFGALAAYEWRVWQDSVRPRLAARDVATQLVTNFRRSGDVRPFSQVPFGYNPAPNTAALAEVLRDPGLRRILPPSLQDALPLAWPEGARVIRPDAVPMSPLPPGLYPWWGNFGGAVSATRGQESSGPCEIRTPVVEFTVAHRTDAGEPPPRLTWRATADDAEHPVPLGEGDGRFRAVRVPLPRGEYRLTIEFQAKAGWVAFSDPRPMSRGSALVRSLFAEARRWFCLAVVAGIAALALEVRRGASAARSPSSGRTD